MKRTLQQKSWGEEIFDIYIYIYILHEKNSFSLHESLLPRGDCMLPISSCLVQVRKNISLLVSSMVIRVIY